MATSLPGPVTEGWTSSTVLYRYHGRWLGILGGVGVVLLALGTTAAAGRDVREKLAAAAPAFLLAGRRRSAVVFVAWHQSVPLLLGTALGAGLYALVSLPLTADGQGAYLDTGVLLGLVVAATVATSVLLAVTSLAAIRMVEGSRETLSL